MPNIVYRIRAGQPGLVMAANVAPEQRQLATACWALVSVKHVSEAQTGASLGPIVLLRKEQLAPSALEDAVCSPGGASIAAVAEAERDGFVPP